MKDRRKYPRVYLQENENLKPILGASALFESVEVKVFDMSYTGLALERVESFAVENGSILDFQLCLGGKKLQLQGHVRWQTDELFGLQLDKIGEKDRLTLMRFIDKKVLGTYVFLVAKELYSQQSFDLWYHGPYDTNIYIWKVSGTLDKAMIELDGFLLSYEDKEFHLVNTKFSQDIEAEYNYYLHSDDSRQVLEPTNPFHLRVIEVLSQIENKPKSIEILLQKLAEI